MADAAARVAGLLAAEAAAATVAGVEATAIRAALAAVAGNVADLTALELIESATNFHVEADMGSPCSTQRRTGHRRHRRSGSRGRCGPAGRSGSRSCLPWGPPGNHGLFGVRDRSSGQQETCVLTHVTLA
jgi:hypothetical protein